MSYQSRIFLSFGAAMLLSVTNLFAQSAEEILKKHTEAVGGTDAWAKVNTLRMTGTMSLMGAEMPVVFTKLRDVGMRQDIEAMGNKIVVVMTPEKGWMKDPQNGTQDVPAEMLEASKLETYIGDMVMEMANHGYKFESSGVTTIDGKPVVPGKGVAEDDQFYCLKALDAAGNATDLFFDKKTYYLVKTGRMMAVQGQEAQVGLKFSDFRKLDGGVVIPMSRTSDSGDLKLTKVEVNPAVDASLFKQ